jgi:hypothetical protein
VQVLVIHEFWKDGTERHRAGEIMTVTPEFFELYRTFLKEVKPRREVTK